MSGNGRGTQYLRDVSILHKIQERRNERVEVFEVNTHVISTIPLC